MNGAYNMNILKFNAKAYNLTQQDIERFTAIPQPRISRLFNLTDQQLIKKLTLKEAVRISALFSLFKEHTTFETLVEIIETTEMETKLNN